jgi:hypothetical protein
MKPESNFISKKEIYDVNEMIEINRLTVNANIYQNHIQDNKNIDYNNNS